MVFSTFDIKSVFVHKNVAYVIEISIMHPTDTATAAQYVL